MDVQQSFSAVVETVEVGGGKKTGLSHAGHKYDHFCDAHPTLKAAGTSKRVTHTTTTSTLLSPVMLLPDHGEDALY